MQFSSTQITNVRPWVPPWVTTQAHKHMDKEHRGKAEQLSILFPPYYSTCHEPCASEVTSHFFKPKLHILHLFRLATPVDVHCSSGYVRIDLRSNNLPGCPSLFYGCELIRSFTLLKVVIILLQITTMS